jgi:putative DNA primase/helicase
MRSAPRSTVSPARAGCNHDRHRIFPRASFRNPSLVGGAAMNDPRIEFFNAMRSGGVAPASPSELVADGLLHRHRIDGDKPGSLNGWHVLHLDAPASGAGGSWKTGQRVGWCSKRQSALTASERAEIARRITEDRKRAQEALEARHRAAAERAARIWAGAAPASRNHPYLTKKLIEAGIARQRGDSLVLPVRDFTGALHGLQFIGPDGSKRFLPGMAKAACFTPAGEQPDGIRPLWIAEGFGTASTLAAMRPAVQVIAALDAGNLRSVAVEARRRWPALELVISPDFDAIGIRKGKEAAEAARALILPPPAEVPAGCTDWNDWAALRREVRHG